MSRSIVIEFLGKDRSLGSTAAGVDRDVSRLGTTLKKVGKIAAIGLAVGAAVAGKAMYDMTKAAIADEAAAANLAKTLQNTAGATKGQVAAAERWITAQGKALGVTDDELRPALARLATATGDVGEAQKLASLAMDVSAGTGKSLEAVSTALMKAQNGQVSGLSRLGIQTKDATGKTLTFEQATKKMADTFGGQATTKANTLEGKMARLKLIFDETKETIGAKLIPVVTKMADWFLTKALPAIQRFGQTLQDNMTTVKVVAGVLGGLWVTLASITVATKVYAAALKIKTAAIKIAAVAMRVFNAVMKMNPIGLVVTAIAAAAAGIVWFATKTEVGRKVTAKLWDGLKSLGSWLAGAGVAAWEKIKGAVEKFAKIGTWMWNTVYQPVFRFIVDGVAKILDMWSRMLSVLGKVPGFEWAKKAADAMAGAADKARDLASDIKKIPPSRTVKIIADTTAARYGLESFIRDASGRTISIGTRVVASGTGVTARAHGGPVRRGRPYLVGEREPELFVPNSSGRILNQRQMRSAGVGSSDGEVARFEIPVVVDGQVIQRSLLTLKRRNGGLELGLA